MIRLAKARVSHSWMGFVGYTFDTLAHTGSHDGMHYAMGYCGSGVSIASYRHAHGPEGAQLRRVRPGRVVRSYAFPENPPGQRTFKDCSHLMLRVKMFTKVAKTSCIVGRET